MALLSIPIKWLIAGSGSVGLVGLATYVGLGTNSTTSDLKPQEETHSLRSQSSSIVTRSETHSSNPSSSLNGGLYENTAGRGTIGDMTQNTRSELQGRMREVQQKFREVQQVQR